jgi:hypothetical protein
VARRRRSRCLQQRIDVKLDAIREELPDPRQLEDGTGREAVRRSGVEKSFVAFHDPR